MNVKHNVILITGGTSGIGFEMAKQFLALDNQVIICSRSLENLQKTKEKLPQVEIIKCDISKENERITLFNEINERFSHLNVLINNAAMTHTANFLDDDEIYQKFLNEVHTNLVAPVHLSQLFLPLLLKNPNATLMNITTGLVYTPKVAYPFYNAMKSAVHSFTQVIRKQLDKEPIKIVEVLFPVVDTPWHKGNPPKIAISPKQAVDEMIKGLKTNQTELKIGKVKLLYWVNRFFPKLAFKIMNRVGNG